MSTDLDMAGGYIPTAVYFHDSDCVEYVKRDEFVIYDRVDEFLTLIYDRTAGNVIGFKLKGFKHIFTQQLEPIYRLNEKQFLSLVSAIEAVCKTIGDVLFDDDERARSYRAARDLAANDNVQLRNIVVKEAA